MYVLENPSYYYAYLCINRSFFRSVVFSQYVTRISINSKNALKWPTKKNTVTCFFKSMTITHVHIIHAPNQIFTIAVKRRGKHFFFLKIVCIHTLLGTYIYYIIYTALLYFYNIKTISIPRVNAILYSDLEFYIDVHFTATRAMSNFKR
jgi:hypothetical protein